MNENLHNLNDEYPDLSDMDESNGQQKNKKNEEYSHALPSKRVKRDSHHEDIDGQENLKGSSIVGPAFLGGKSFIPPPPPKDKKNSFLPPELPSSK
jgi:hypothetical protein